MVLIGIDPYPCETTWPKWQSCGSSLNLGATRQHRYDVQLGHSVASCYLFVNSLHCMSLWLAWVALETRPQMSTKGKVLLSLLVASRSGSIWFNTCCRSGVSNWFLNFVPLGRACVAWSAFFEGSICRTPGAWESLIHRRRLSVRVLNSKSRTLQ